MPGRRAGRLVLIALLGTAVAWAATHRELFELAALDRLIERSGGWGPAVFVALYATATVLFVPGSVFGLAGGALFGPLWGSVWNLLGASLGATAAFIVARHLAANWIAQHTGSRLAPLAAGIHAEGWRFVAFVRLVPLFPFNLLNFALGLTRIALVPYVMATALAMLPGTVAYTWLGYAGRAALGGEPVAVRAATIALALIAAMVFLPRLVRRWRVPAAAWIEVSELKQAIAAGRDLMIIDVREAAEFAGKDGHLPGAVNMPLREIPNHLAEFAAWSDREVVLTCHTDKRSAQAAAVFRSAGIAGVRVLRGGIVDWNRCGT